MNEILLVVAFFSIIGLASVSARFSIPLVSGWVLKLRVDLEKAKE